ncbi:hypothetical protein DWQ65_06105 [Treponema phagedenis]|uniref:Uncharacterized protein n=1 Tax=Treponema phagedenis TaxID=162 RepID=A0AAE6IT01_TREPH|nr:hypothetical protein FUT79_05760 [Treponema phagedenis]QEJ97700.1 hypothetical protein FUT82_06615 [Treponema phagedenis]QEK00669.1 hypothetical protein FUT84_05450 [Treponema phagedenis]QEK03268.1 hypothetical protein FUT83_05225 [Treponema phagedenis]QEK05678.1 hypothetical protein FUT80_02370 [Treponema phagedenis]
MVNCSPLLNSKRCLKASTLFCKIEAFKLVGEPKVAIPRSRRCAVSNSEQIQTMFKSINTKL